VSQGPNAAILFEPSAFDAKQPMVKGRHVAGASFLDGFVRHAEVDRYVGCAMRRDHGPAFVRQIQDTVADTPEFAARPIDVVQANDPFAIARHGCLHVADPSLPRYAWRRRYVGQRAFSITGITHTISSERVMEMLTDYLIAPVQSWDALICTSASVRAAVQRIQDDMAAYMETRTGASPRQPAQLPVIPLGVDAERFASLGSNDGAGQFLRQRLGIAENDIAVLFFGRLTLHAKAHPSPMYQAMQRAADMARPHDGGRLHLIMTGQFSSDGIERYYRDAVTPLCPDVPVHFVDGADPNLAGASWAAADIFLSLSDNIQESFGITPVEAMAAGLPCVVSDWDGYRDTVVEGETGFRVPSWLPPAGAGAGLAAKYGLGNMSYDRFIGYVSLMTAVEIEPVARAIDALARDPGRRRAMAVAGQDRARTVYDWSVIIPQYQALWGELAARRSKDAENAPPGQRGVNPLAPDPVNVFAGHATETLSFEHRIRRTMTLGEIDSLFDVEAHVYGAEAFLDRKMTRALAACFEGAPISVNQALETMPSDRRVVAARTLLWMAKFGAVTFEAPSGAVESKHQASTEESRS